MRASCSSLLGDDFDDFDENCNEKSYYSSSNLPISLRNDDFPFLDDYCQQNIKKEEEEEDFHPDEQLEINNCHSTIDYNPILANFISKELGLNDPQTSRKNAWGNLSYAELIAKAIENSLYQRLTLSQIYSWMIQYVPYFRDKGDRKSSTGWKNSIRHNLSLHNRFVRIPNEIAGKSSWWTIDPRAKQVRGRRKTQSNENSTKNSKRRLTKSVSNEPSNASYSLSNQRSFTSVRDMNKSLYHHLQNQSFTSTQPIPNILHDMLKSSPLQTSNYSNSGMDITYSPISKCASSDCQSPPFNTNTNDDELISSKLSKQLKTMDRSNPLFRRMVLAIMRHKMNKSKSTNEREINLSTPPPSALITSSSSIDHLQLNTLTNSTFDLDVETILDFERTTFGDCSFDIHDLPNL